MCFRFFFEFFSQISTFETFFSWFIHRGYHCSLSLSLYNSATLMPIIISINIFISKEYTTINNSTVR